LKDLEITTYPAATNTPSNKTVVLLLLLFIYLFLFLR
jgi:hypothetical protein